MTFEKQQAAIAELLGPPLFVLHKPIHDPFGYYREDARGYTNNISEAWKVTAEVAAEHVTGRPDQPDRVIAEPAPLPNITDLNAIHDLESWLLETKGEQVFRVYVDHLVRLMEPGQFAISARVSQRRKAILQTLGKWEES